GLLPLASFGTLKPPVWPGCHSFRKSRSRKERREARKLWEWGRTAVRGAVISACMGPPSGRLPFSRFDPAAGPIPKGCNNPDNFVDCFLDCREDCREVKPGTMCPVRCRKACRLVECLEEPGGI